ncbi:cytochrome C oxidase subunit IV family protein [Verrucomicrobiales bacterium]|nr:cytochrome C oxidase subunit IV family protein [Verrucomicrobiales bacterium]
MADTPEELQKHVKAYTIVGAALLVFTVITVAVTYVDLGSTFVNVGIGLGIATFKAGLVAYIFMHLNHERPMIYRILVFTFFFVAGMFLLFMLAQADPITRFR